MPPRDDRMPLDGSAPDAFDDASLVQGKWVILGVVVLAVAASIVSWVYYARLQKRPLDLWGTGAAELMLRAPTARAYQLAPAGSGALSGRQFTIDGVTYSARPERDVSHAPGFSHVRQGLIHDRSFAWDDPPCGDPARWDYAIEFADGNQAAVVAFDVRCARAMLPGGTRSVSIRPIAEAIEGFLREQFPDEAQTPRPQ